jgi:protein-S-isoprenylcysteine O-methyltransferase Ste14
MISGVLSILLGEAALFGSTAVLVWFLAFFAFQAVYMPMIEERGLTRRFGEDYLVYKRNVPRWMPRLTPWVPRFDER